MAKRLPGKLIITTQVILVSGTISTRQPSGKQTILKMGQSQQDAQVTLINSAHVTLINGFVGAVHSAYEQWCEEHHCSRGG